MKEQHRIETPEQRSERGREMLVDMGEGSKLIVGYDGNGRAQWDDIPSVDWLYHHDRRKKLTSSERATFDLEFVKARAIAGVRPAVDLALSAMRAKLMLRLGRGRWGAL